MHNKQRLIELIQYCKSVAQLNINTVSNYNNHDIFSINEDSFADLKDYIKFDFAGFINNNQSCVIPKLSSNKAPEVNQPDLEVWLEKSNNVNKIPKLLRVITKTKDTYNVNDSEISLETFEDRALIESSFKKYLAEWTLWAEKEKRIKKVQKLYNDLYNLQQQLDNVELLCGVGVILWKLNNIKIIYPTITKPVNLLLDQTTGNIIIEPHQSKSFRLELEVLKEHNLNNISILESQFDQLLLNNNDNNESELNNIEAFLKVVSNVLDSTGELLAKDSNITLAKPSPTENLIILNTWIIFARPKSRAVVIDDYIKFMNKLEALDGESSEIQEIGAIQTLLEEISESNIERVYKQYRGICTYNNDRLESSAQELYFPLPFNEEQVKIIKRLDIDDGVVVQGPPGTGKTHTIANIICHFLASGKKILVTSMRSHALQVIRDKLPDSIKDLAVNMLSNDNQGLQQFKDSIEKIANRIQTINIQHERELVSQYEEKLNYDHAKLELISKELKEINNKYTGSIRFDEQDCQVNHLAQEYATNKDNDLSYIQDDLTISEEFSLKVSPPELQNLYQIRNAVIDNLDLLNIDFQEIKQVLNNLPSEEEILKIHSSQQLDNEINNAILDGKLIEMIDYSEESLQKLELLNNLLIDMRNVYSINLADRIVAYDWVHNCCNYLYESITNNDNDLLDKLMKCTSDAENLYKTSLNFVERPVTIDSDAICNDNIKFAIQKLSLSKKPFGISGLFGKNKDKLIIKSTTVAGSYPRHLTDWQHVLEYIEINQLIMQFIYKFNSFAEIINCEQYDLSLSKNPITSIRELYYICQTIHHILRLITYYVRLINLYKQIMPSFTLQKLSLHEVFIQNLKLLEHSTESHLKKSRYRLDSDKKTQILSLISKLPPKIKQDISQMFNQLGNLQASDLDILTAYRNTIVDINKLIEFEPKFQIILDVANKIEQSGGKLMAQSIKYDKSWQLPDPVHLFKAWRLKRLKSYFTQDHCLDKMQQLITQRKTIESDLKKTYEDLIAKKSWISLVASMNPKIKSSLILFLKAVTAVGKGTGKSANIHRQIALNASLDATAAVPCWIIPHDKVCEFLPKDFALFDLVIIDEASQSDLIALTSIFRAKKILIVGDDKQVSPEEIGISDDKKRSLIKQHLSNQVSSVKEILSTKNSMYDLFSVMFSDIIMLKEHFRCVAPIIEYSKRKFYQDMLVPLRMAKKSEQIIPPLVDVYVKNGVRNHKDENFAEMKFIIEEIKAITDLEQFANKTIGICTLHGNKQYRYIEAQISREIDSAILQKHHIKCGDPKVFQGDERDIMFLSMVVSKNEDTSFQALGKNTDNARFNVATSRARDRMYLVRSIGIADLSEKDDLRKSLIEHFANPFPYDSKKIAKLRDLCDSEFEKEMYDILVDRGYNIQPQVKSGGYIIDFVVSSDSDATLAIECDGDSYHSGDKWDKDMYRQSILQGAGWQFWRCFASDFYSNKEKIILDLFNTLEKCGIFPSSHSNKDEQYREHSHVEYREYIAVAPVQNEQEAQEDI